MGKGRTGMNEVSVYMDACVRVWKERENGGVNWLLNFTYIYLVYRILRLCAYVSL